MHVTAMMRVQNAAMMRVLALLGAATVANAHGSMIMPPSRNSVDADLAAWSHGKFPPTGL